MYPNPTKRGTKVSRFHELVSGKRPRRLKIYHYRLPYLLLQDLTAIMSLYHPYYILAK